jgi:hypothetical protein
MEYLPSPAGVAAAILLLPLVSVSYSAAISSLRISSGLFVVRVLSAQFLSSEVDLPPTISGSCFLPNTNSLYFLSFASGTVTM